MPTKEKCPKCGNDIHPGNCPGLGGGGGDESEAQKEKDKVLDAKKNAGEHQVATAPATPPIVFPTDAKNFNLPPAGSAIPSAKSQVSKRDSNDNPKDNAAEDNTKEKKFKTPFSTGTPKPRPDGE